MKFPVTPDISASKFDALDLNKSQLTVVGEDPNETLDLTTEFKDNLFDQFGTDRERPTIVVNKMYSVSKKPSTISKLKINQQENDFTYNARFSTVNQD